MFEQSSRLKLRFPYKGSISDEDLWDLDVKILNKMYQDLYGKLKQTAEVSLLDIKSDADKILELQLNIIKHIVKVKLEETQKRLEAKDRKAYKEKLLAIRASKEDEALHQKSPEEIDKLLAEIDA